MSSTSLCSALLLAPTALWAAATAPEPDLNKTFKRMEVQIPMRDGVKLYTDIYIPKKSRGQLPFLFTRTPYGSTDDKGRNGLLPHSYKDFVDEGYIFVFQDIRGRYKSEGQFVMFRPPRGKSDAKAIDESTDTYDSIAWLIEHIPNNNGRAGVLGISYGGWLTVMAMLDPHPALKAVSEQASPADQFLGDDFHHNGAFRLSYGLEYSAMMETGTTNFNFKFDRHDTFEWYVALGALANFNKNYGHEKIPTWNDFVAHPNYDEFWQKQAVTPYLDTPKVPNLNVAGWWDQEDFYGPMKIYETLEKKDTNHMNYVVAGPWNHGGWSRGEGRKLGDIDFDSDTAQYFREKVQAPWFAYWLKDKGPFKQPEALTFQTGSNRWESYDEWPPRSRTTDRPLYFQSAGMASFAKPEGETGANNEFDSYISDPARPVPYRHRPISPTYPDGGWPAWLVEDQRFVHLRPDVLSWETDPLQQDVAIAGDVVAHLFASTSGTDSDWIVKLIDVYPEDYPKDAKMGGY
jgi:putative CocE/NonD family hydrolase